MLVLVTLGFVSNCHARSCSVGDVVPGEGWVFKDVPCSQLERPIPCTKEWTDEKGNWNSVVIDCPPGHKQKTYEQVEREETAQKKRRCGKDFEKLRIGMSLERFEQCTDGVVFVTDSMTANGMVETYRSTFHYLLVKNGRIVSYTRRTR